MKGILAALMTNTLRSPQRLSVRSLVVRALLDFGLGSTRHHDRCVSVTDDDGITAEEVLDGFPHLGTAEHGHQANHDKDRQQQTGTGAFGHG
jgi:hypothetical protein